MAKSGWDEPPTDYIEVAVGIHTKFMKEASLRMLRGVILKSPVDTGRFRANWQVTHGVGTRGLVQSFNKGKNKSSESAVTTQTFRSGAKTIKNIGNFAVVYLTNNLPYAKRLENGWSNQAPSGMVALTMIEVKTWLDKQK